jgi:hypothetical protein
MLTIELPFPPAELNPNRKNGRHWGATEDAVLRAGWQSRTHEEMAVELGRTRKGVRNRCWVLGLVDTSNAWTDGQIAALKASYEASEFAEEIDLTSLAKSLGKLKSNVCRKARALGLTNQSRPMLRPEKRRVRGLLFDSADARSLFRSELSKRIIAERGHPRGALGMKHTPEALAKISAASLRHAASMTAERRVEITMKSMRTRAANGTLAPPRNGTTWKAAWREIGGVRKFYRSKWEANYAYYLQWLKDGGHIADWKHEPTTFWFEGVKRGTVSYLPDFWVKENSGAEAYHEVKGWMDDRSKTKIRRMAKYHPKVKLIVIDSKGYAALKKSVAGLVPGWEA